MADIEKVITAFKVCKSDNYTCSDCPYNDESCTNTLSADALELLKKQEEQIKNHDESLEKAREEIKWLRGMLKEQESKDRMFHALEDDWKRLKELLKEQEAVVRCKDCKYSASDMACTHPNEWGNEVSRNDGNPDWFCADGERKK